MQQAFIAASATVEGSEQRIEALLDEMDALHSFIDEVEQLLTRGEMASLPPVIEASTGCPLPGVHKLTISPWEGAFLVSADGQQVIGLVFSREPHNYLRLLGNLLARHAEKGA